MVPWAQDAPLIPVEILASTRWGLWEAVSHEGAAS